MNKIKQLFKRRKPKFGAAIFHQRTWLTKKVDEAILTQRQIKYVDLGPTKEQK